MAEVKISFEGTVQRVEASNPNTAAAALMGQLAIKDPGFQGKLGTAIATALDPCNPDRFKTFSKGVVECDLPPSDVTRRLKVAIGVGVGVVLPQQPTGRRYAYDGPHGAVPLSPQVDQLLNGKVFSGAIAAENLWIKTTGGEYQVKSILGKKEGVNGTNYVVEKDGVSCVWKTNRQNLAGYAAERAALEKLGRVAGVIDLVPHSDAVILLPKASGSISEWRRDERTVLKAFKALAEALHEMLCLGLWHDDHHLGNVVFFSDENLEYIDIGGETGNSENYLKNVVEFAGMLESVISGEISEQVATVIKSAKAKEIATITDFKSRLW